MLEFGYNTVGNNFVEHTEERGYYLTNRHHTAKTLEGNKRRVKPLTVAQRHEATDAHHKLQTRRAKLGLPSFGSGPHVEQNYAELNSTSGFILNLLTGMSYSGSENSKCYAAVEDFVVGLDTGSDIFKKIYIPAYAAEAQVQAQDLIAVTSAVYVDCALDKAFTTLTHLASSEGVSVLVGRVSGALPFEIAACQKVYSNRENYNTKEAGNIYGKCVSIILNWTI